MRHLVFSLTAAALFVGCAMDKQQLRALVSSPPDFRNIDETYLQDSMWRLANGVQQLDDTMNDATLAEAAREERVIAVLGDMADAATQANQPGTKKSHQNVAMNIDKLITDIEAAKAAAQAHDLRPARVIPVTCLACHEGAAGGAQKK